MSKDGQTREGDAPSTSAEQSHSIIDEAHSLARTDEEEIELQRRAQGAFYIFFPTIHTTFCT